MQEEVNRELPEQRTTMKQSQTIQAPLIDNSKSHQVLQAQLNNVKTFHVEAPMTDLKVNEAPVTATQSMEVTTQSQAFTDNCAPGRQASSSPAFQVPVTDTKVPVTDKSHLFAIHVPFTNNRTHQIYQKPVNQVIKDKMTKPGTLVTDKSSQSVIQGHSIPVIMQVPGLCVSHVPHQLVQVPRTDQSAHYITRSQVGLTTAKNNTKEYGTTQSHDHETGNVSNVPYTYSVNGGKKEDIKEGQNKTRTSPYNPGCSIYKPHPRFRRPQPVQPSVQKVDTPSQPVKFDLFHYLVSKAFGKPEREAIDEAYHYGRQRCHPSHTPTDPDFLDKPLDLSIKLKVTK